MTPRKPNLFLVSGLYILLGFLLMQLVTNLSALGQFQHEIMTRSMAAMDSFVRAGGSLALEIPTINPTVFGLFFFIVPWIFLWVLDLGYLYYARGIVKGEEMGYRSLFEGFSYFAKAVLIRLLMAITIFSGLFLFILPGLWAVCAFSQANLLLLDNPDRGVFWCLRESRRLMRGRKIQYLGLIISFFGWWFLTTLPFISLAARMWYLPYLTFTQVGYYNGLTGQGPQTSEWKRPGMF